MIFILLRYDIISWGIIYYSNSLMEQLPILTSSHAIISETGTSRL